MQCYILQHTTIDYKDKNKKNRIECDLIYYNITLNLMKYSRI